MRKYVVKNGWLSAFYTVATLYVGTCAGTSLLLALLK